MGRNKRASDASVPIAGGQMNAFGASDTRVMLLSRVLG